MTARDSAGWSTGFSRLKPGLQHLLHVLARWYGYLFFAAKGKSCGIRSRNPGKLGPSPSGWSR